MSSLYFLLRQPKKGLYFLRVSDDRTLNKGEKTRNTRKKKDVGNKKELQRLKKHRKWRIRRNLFLPLPFRSFLRNQKSEASTRFFFWRHEICRVRFVPFQLPPTKPVAKGNTFWASLFFLTKYQSRDWPRFFSWGQKNEEGGGEGRKCPRIPYQMVFRSSKIKDEKMEAFLSSEKKTLPWPIDLKSQAAHFCKRRRGGGGGEERLILFTELSHVCLSLFPSAKWLLQCKTTFYPRSFEGKLNFGGPTMAWRIEVATKKDSKFSRTCCNSRWQRSHDIIKKQLLLS